MSRDALKALSTALDTSLPDLSVLSAVYEGVPQLDFVAPSVKTATEGRLKTLNPNLARLVVQAVAERLEVTGFSIGVDEQAGGELWNAWNAADLDLAQHLAHEEALVYGRSFLLVWGHPDAPTRPVVTVESAEEMAVSRDPASRQVTAALKRFKGADGHGHAYTYLPEEVVHYVTRRPLAEMGVTAHVPVSDYLVADTITNPLGLVPVVPMVARPSLGNLDGTSEIADVVPLSRALAKVMTDALVGSEYFTQPRRWVTGLEVQVDAEGNAIDPFGSSPRSVVIEPPDARTGNYQEATLDGYASLVNLLVSQIGSVSSTPPGYLMQQRDQPASAEALLAAEIALVSKIRQRQRTFGAAWASALGLAVEISTGRPRPDLARATTRWRNPEHPSQASLADAAQKQVALGIPLEVVAGGLLGYSPEQVDEIRAAKRREALDGSGIDLSRLIPQPRPDTSPEAV